MNARLTKFLPIILRHEGGAKFTNDADDPGGATKYGISLRYLKGKGVIGDFDHDGDVDLYDIKAMTVAQAAELYDIDFWSPCGCEAIHSDRVALMMFDCAVNIGVRSASRILQTASGVVKVDGIVGMDTLYHVNVYDPAALSLKFAELWRSHYDMIIKRNPALRKYKTGWNNRVSDSLITPL